MKYVILYRHDGRYMADVVLYDTAVDAAEHAAAFPDSLVVTEELHGKTLEFLRWQDATSRAPDATHGPKIAGIFEARPNEIISLPAAPQGFRRQAMGQYGVGDDGRVWYLCRDYDGATGDFGFTWIDMGRPTFERRS